MKTSKLIAGLLLAAPALALAQGPPPPPNWIVATGPAAGKRVMLHRELGKWWQNSDIVKKLQISDSQIAQLDQIFFEHRMKLIDYGAEMEKQDLKLQTLLDADVPDEAQINSQVDQVLDARGKLEREFTMMNLDLRRVLSLGQWRQLKSIQGGPAADKVFYFHKKLPPGAPVPPDGPMVLPLPPPDGL